MANDCSTTETSPDELVSSQSSASVARPRARRGYELHIITLVMSICVLTVAALLTVQGETRVDVPFINRPLPALCHMKRMTGLDCPGCGLTRCFIALAHGDVLAAWHFNPAGLLVFALVAIQIPYRSVQLWRLRHGLPELTHRRLTSVFTAIVVSALVLQWAWKLCIMASTWNA